MSPRTEKQNQTILDRRREEILDAALNEFARKGYNGTKISDIAKASSISQGLIYHYYNSKDELYAAVIERSIDNSNVIVQSIEKYDLKGWTGLTAMTEGLVKWIGNGGDELLNFFFMYQAMMLEPMPECIKAALSKEMKAVSTTAKLIGEAQKEGSAVEGDADTLASLYWSLVQGIIMNKIVSRHIGTRDYYADLNSEFVLRIIRK